MGIAIYIAIWIVFVFALRLTLVFVVKIAVGSLDIFAIAVHLSRSFDVWI